jgi:hypothetical protein
VSQVGGPAAYDLIHWYTNKSLRVSVVQSEQAVQSRGHGGSGDMLCHTMLERDLRLVELAPRGVSAAEDAMR